MKVQKNKLVVYTAIFGDYDGLIPQPRIKGVDFVCFTDKSRISYPWKIIKIKPTNVDNNRAAKIYKVLPHKYLPQYARSLWVDANFILKGDYKKFIEDKLDNGDVWFFNHDETLVDRRNCIYSELDGIINYHNRTGKIKDNVNIMVNQLNNYRNEGYPANNGLISGGIILRNHNNSQVKQLMELWWHEIENGSKRDQLSFNYAAWKLGYKVNYLEGDIRNHKYFYMLSQHKKSYLTKWIKYILGIYNKQF